MMRIGGIVARAALAVGTLALGACQQPYAPYGQAGGRWSGGSTYPQTTPRVTPVRSAADQREGDRAHNKIVAQFGGVYHDAQLAAYVDRVGRRLAAVTEQAGAPWTFTVLDSPTVNAFAVPGGYVYVTRGLVGLAGDEAELAGVLGHEIGHVVAGHSAQRRERTSSANLGLLAGAIGLSVLGVDPNAAGALMNLGQTAAGGYLASYSRAEEFEADRLGVRYLARAGYDPYAEAQFLERLKDWEALRARVSGRAYDPNRVSFLASHPATAERTRAAIRLARQSGAFGRERDTARFLAAIDGLVWGDSRNQGFVRGRTFSHPRLGFGFTVPPGFTIRNASDRVTASGPRGSRFIFDAGRDPGGSLTGYIAGRWAPAIARAEPTGRLSGLEGRRIGGLDAARAVLPVQIGGQVYDALLVAVRLNGKVYRMTGLAPRGSGMVPALESAARSFHRLSAAKAARLGERRIHVVMVKPGETAGSLARRMNVEDLRLEHFRVLNGLAPGQTLRVGQEVKLVQ